MSRLRKEGKRDEIRHVSIGHNKVDLGVHIENEFDSNRGNDVQGRLPQKYLQKYAAERYVAKMEALLNEMFKIRRIEKYPPKEVIELNTHDWEVMKSALKRVSYEYDWMPKVRIYESDLSEQKAHAVARYTSSEIHVGSTIIGDFSDDGKRWLISHEYGHLMMNIMIGNGVAFSEFAMIDEMLPPKCYRKLAGLSDGDPIRWVEEAFAEAVALAYCDFEDKRVNAIRRKIFTLVSRMDDAPF